MTTGKDTVHRGFRSYEEQAPSTACLSSPSPAPGTAACLGAPPPLATDGTLPATSHPLPAELTGGAFRAGQTSMKFNASRLAAGGALPSFFLAVPVLRATMNLYAFTHSCSEARPLFGSELRGEDGPLHQAGAALRPVFPGKELPGVTCKALDCWDK